MIKTICFIADGYPTNMHFINTFLENLVNEFATQGINCIVIAPQSITRAITKKRQLPPKKEVRIINGKKVKIFFPRYISTSSKKIAIFNTAQIGLYSFQKSSQKILKKLIKTHKIDALYGHFICPAGFTVDYLGAKYGIPSFFAYGENTTYTIDYLGKTKTRQKLKRIAGVISVSTHNKNTLIKNGIISKIKIGVFPNAINEKLFYKQDKDLCRKRLSFPSKDFIVAFTGRLEDVKGPDRLSAALDRLNDDTVSAFFIGEGPIKPSYKKTLLSEKVQHSEIASYLSAADVFVLPTKAEGCCNAIIEALACGLPVVSSKAEFNKDILDETCSILINPNNINEIRDAIQLLKNDRKLYDKLSKGALQKADTLRISKRARNILSFMETKSNNE